MSSITKSREGNVAALLDAKDAGAVADAIRTICAAELRENVPLEGRFYKGPCVYILYAGKEPIYVGQTRNFWRRMPGHAEKEADGFRLIECGGPSLNEIEGLLIRTLKPKHNRNQGPQSRCWDVLKDAGHFGGRSIRDFMSRTVFSR